MSTVRVQAAGQEALDRARTLLAGVDQGVERAVKAALSRSVSHLRTNSAKAIRERYAISAANIRAEETITVRYSYQNGVQAVVTFAGQKIPLYRYDGASPKVPTQDRSRKISAFVSGEWRKVHPGVPAQGHQLRSSAPQTFENAFVARMSSGHTGIFARAGGSAAGSGDAIREIMGSSVPQMLSSEEVSETLVNESMQKFEERLEHEVLRILNGWGG